MAATDKAIFLSPYSAALEIILTQPESDNNLYAEIFISHLFYLLCINLQRIHYTFMICSNLCAMDLFNRFIIVYRTHTRFFKQNSYNGVFATNYNISFEFYKHMPSLSQECSSVLPLKDLLRTWFLSCSISSGFCCCICCANCCPLCWTVLHKSTT